MSFGSCVEMNTGGVCVCVHLTMTINRTRTYIFYTDISLQSPQRPALIESSSLITIESGRAESRVSNGWTLMVFMVNTKAHCLMLWKEHACVCVGLICPRKETIGARICWYTPQLALYIHSSYAIQSTFASPLHRYTHCTLFIGIAGERLVGSLQYARFASCIDFYFVFSHSPEAYAELKLNMHQNVIFTYPICIGDFANAWKRAERGKC